MDHGFEDLRTFFDPDLLLPVGGTEYRIPCPTAEQGLALKARMLSPKPLSNEEELRLLQQICGDELWDQLKRELSWPKVIHVARTGLVHYGYGPESAVVYWEKGLDAGNPLPPPPMRQRVVGALGRMRLRTRARQGSTGIGTPAAAPG